jgi:hypothetical protein
MSDPPNRRTSAGGRGNLAAWLTFAAVVVGGGVIAVILNWNPEPNSNGSPAALSRDSQISIWAPTATQTELTEIANSPSVKSPTETQLHWQIVLDTVRGGPFLKSFMPTSAIDKIPEGRIGDYSLLDILHGAKKLCGQIEDFHKLVHKL